MPDIELFKQYLNVMKNDFGFKFYNVVENETTVDLKICDHIISFTKNKNKNLYYLKIKNTSNNKKTIKKVELYRSNFRNNVFLTNISYDILRKYLIAIKIFEFLYEKTKKDFNIEIGLKIENNFSREVSLISFLYKGITVFYIKELYNFNPININKKEKLNSLYQKKMFLICNNYKVNFKKELFFKKEDFRFYWNEIFKPILKHQIKLIDLKNDFKKDIKLIIEKTNKNSFKRKKKIYKVLNS